MNAPNGFERRDPISPVLRLGSVLSEVRREEGSGIIQVMDRGQVHSIRVCAGAISHIDRPGAISEARGATPFAVHESVARMFSLARPHVAWVPDPSAGRGPRLLDPLKAVLSGVTARSDLFDPRVLARRIPVDSVAIPHDKLDYLRRLPFTREERRFLSRLEVPTPVTMALWKRGLPPRSAGALLVALNLLGVWEGKWDPGVLPRLTMATRILERIRRGQSPAEVLGVSHDDEAQQDSMFRKLSLELHPDRVTHLGGVEAEHARRAFDGLNDAYQKLRAGRRKRPVRVPEENRLGKVRLVKKEPDTWRELYDQALTLLESGDGARARIFALKALSKSPPEAYRSRLTALISAVA